MYNRYIRNDNGVYDRVPRLNRGRRRGQSSVRLFRRRRRSGSF